MTYTSHSSHIKGRLAEVKALSHFTTWGCEVASVLGDNTSCDMIILHNGLPLRVEVKAGVVRKNSKAPMATIGSKKSRSLPVDTDRFDLLAVYLDSEDVVLVWNAADVDVSYTWTVTEARRDIALKGEADLVASTDLMQRRMAALRQGGDVSALPVTPVAEAVQPAGDGVADSEVR
jgi:hypothetical protein